MILTFVNIRKVHREVLKTRNSPSVFNTFLGTLRMLMNGKSCLNPLFIIRNRKYVAGYQSNDTRPSIISVITQYANGSQARLMVLEVLHVLLMCTWFR